MSPSNIKRFLITPQCAPVREKNQAAQARTRTFLDHVQSVSQKRCGNSGEIGHQGAAIMFVATRTKYLDFAEYDSEMAS